MKIIILGAGQVGSTAAFQLARQEANEVTIVDHNATVLRDLQDRLDVRTVVGHAAYPATLERAGAADADMIIALTSSDEVNMVACSVAHTLFHIGTKIARVRSAEYIATPNLFSPEAIPIDMRISPEQLVTQHIQQLIHYPGSFQVLDFADGRVRLVGVRARRDGLLVNQRIRNLKAHIPNVEVRIAAVYRAGQSVPTDGETLIRENDEVFFIAGRNDIRTVMAEMRKLEPPVRRVVIAGGGNIGLRLASALEQTNNVKVIERDRERAQRISERLAKAIVLHGDAADEELLLEENIDTADVFVAVTNADEANILSAMLAKQLGCRKVMALVNRPAYAGMVETGRVDVAISPQQITIGSLLALARKGDMVKVHSLRRGRAEAIEAVAHGNAEISRVVGRTVEQVALPPGTTMNVIVREDKVMEAHHDTLIRTDDHIIMFLTDRRQVDQVARLFQLPGRFR
ncbi:Trk system potassium uptake protein TrkA [Gammaproteobacteria bacterium]|nr:Trk system potassium transporter TrkA [Gammaproteobacteria bacterium]QOJ32804.1 MAG: Trk system potassium transporter TrkA [Gammaproteobacteria bacterium]CAG0944285.1 Trk system potassium uptake protein TrkA [Gammaproteobacteria bacterium]